MTVGLVLAGIYLAIGSSMWVASEGPPEDAVDVVLAIFMGLVWPIVVLTFLLQRVFGDRDE